MNSNALHDHICLKVDTASALWNVDLLSSSKKICLSFLTSVLTHGAELIRHIHAVAP